MHLREFLAFLSAALVATTALGNCEVNASSARNTNGSVMKLRVSFCEGSNRRDVSVYYQKAVGTPLRKVLSLQQDAEEAPTGGASLTDLDGDGEHEIELRGTCGAGPNCEGTIYRLREDRTKMFRLFWGGYSSLSHLAGHIVESGRASCCAWEHHVYLQRSRFKEIGASDMVYRVVVGTTQESDKTIGPTCTFYDLGDKLVSPKTRALLPLCEIYGSDYILAAPDR
jgi:hypothetical protein